MTVTGSTPPGVARDLVVDADLLAQIVEVSADAIFSENLDHRILTWNAAAERLYGRAAADMIGRSTRDLLPAETASQLGSVHQVALSGQRVERFDSQHLRSDGQRIPVSLTVSPLRTSDGAVAGLGTSVKDVTDRVELTEELARTHRVLETQYAAVLRSNRDLEQFAYVASHDLSEPLRVMSNFVQLLEKRYADVLDERGARYVRHIVDGAVRMRVLIEDLLGYSQFLRVEREPTEVDVEEVARRAVASLGTEQVEIQPLPSVYSDDASLYAVLQNLISNALKFHREGSPPRVVVSGVIVGDRVQLSVDDDGIGIAPEHRERVFRMFSRLHVREAYTGTGIGLAIVQRIAERTDGRVWIESSELGGSRFCITFPAGPTKADVS